MAVLTHFSKHLSGSRGCGGLQLVDGRVGQAVNFPDEIITGRTAVDVVDVVRRETRRILAPNRSMSGSE